MNKNAYIYKTPDHRHDVTMTSPHIPRRKSLVLRYWLGLTPLPWIQMARSLVMRPLSTVEMQTFSSLLANAIKSWGVESATGHKEVGEKGNIKP
jgi:hypothetical protein